MRAPCLAGLLALVLLAACAPAEPTQGTAAPPPATAGSSAVAIVSNRPPEVDNDAPAGVCENTANITSRVVRADTLFRALAFDNRAGSGDGDGIEFVRFTVVGDDLLYQKDESEAPFCMLGGNEPGCGRWTRDEDGRYTWGSAGPVVRPGRYEVQVDVVAAQADSLSGRNTCSWRFAMRVTPP